MASVNKIGLQVDINTTFEGAAAAVITPEQQLRRLVMACLLWEDSFYVDGKKSADLIKDAVHNTDPDIVAEIAIEAREKGKLRHVPLLLARELARGNKEARLVVANLLERIIQRPDELTEFLAIYWAQGKQPLSAQVKKGLAKAFHKFDEYSLSKYNRDSPIKLRDVMFLTHVKPKGSHGINKAHRKTAKEKNINVKLSESELLFQKVAENKLGTADTWEVALSAGKDKKEEFTRLINEGGLGALALLRNLRNMKESGVDDNLIRKAILEMKTERVLPFRFISAAKYAPNLEEELEATMFRSVAELPKLKGTTCLLIDVSGSMQGKVSGKSEITRLEAAIGVGMLLREICESAKICVFGTNAFEAKPRRGFALRDEIMRLNEGGGTNTERGKILADSLGYDRIIIITDEQSATHLSDPKGLGYVINVAGYQNGIGYGKWLHIDGWSESVVAFIQNLESQPSIEEKAPKTEPSKLVKRSSTAS